MFILRQNSENGAEVNTFLGKSYQVVDANHKDFLGIIKDNGLGGHIQFLIFDDDRNIHPIYANNGNSYIVMGSGKTFFTFRDYGYPVG